MDGQNHYASEVAVVYRSMLVGRCAAISRFAVGFEVQYNEGRDTPRLKGSNRSPYRRRESIRVDSRSR